jgi:hypothetical protein
MSIWNKVLAGVIAVVALVFFYMTASAMGIHKYWHKSMVDHQRAIKATAAENVALLEGSAGDAATPGVRRLRLDVHKSILDRGRMWRNCAARITNGQTGEVAVTIDASQPHGIPAKSVLYLFSQADFEKGGRYLGEFRAAQVDEGKRLVALQPTMKLSEREVKRLAEHKGAVLMCEVMPADNHQAFADLKPADLKAILPEQTLAEYARDGQDAKADDPANRKVKDGDKEKFVRQLRDYRVLLAGLFRDRTVLSDRIASASVDIDRVDAAIAESKRQEEYCRTQIESLKKDVAEVNREKDATVAHRKAIEDKLGQLKQLIDTGIASNRAMADELGRLQLEATRRIDQRVGTMVSNAPGALQ